MFRRLTERKEWKFFAVLPKAAPRLAAIWWIVLWARGVLPALFAIAMGVLVGDVNGNAAVNAGDVSLTKAQVGQGVGSSNFREDVNANGVINVADVAQIKTNLGSSLPP